MRGCGVDTQQMHMHMYLLCVYDSSTENASSFLKDLILEGHTNLLCVCTDSIYIHVSAYVFTMCL